MVHKTTASAIINRTEVLTMVRRTEALVEILEASMEEDMVDILKSIWVEALKDRVNGVRIMGHKTGMADMEDSMEATVETLRGTWVVVLEALKVKG
jgi:hypothetical protein